MFPKKGEIVIVDGGFSSQISRYTSRPIDGDALWTARLLATDKQAIINVYYDFFKGADLVITNTYQASIEGFMKHLHLTREESYNLIKESVTLANVAREKYLSENTKTNIKIPLIVGSVGPYGASLHDASEYSGAYADTTSVQVMKEWHIPRINALIEAGVDLLALETIPCKAEAVMLTELLKEYPSINAWLSFSCREDGKHISYGENFQETARHCYDNNPDQLVAVGTNCLAPKLVEQLFNGINSGREDNLVPLIVYPNSGETFNVEWKDKDKCAPLANFVAKWLDMGITWIGGCCRTYAEDITSIKEEVEKWKRNHKK